MVSGNPPMPIQKDVSIEVDAEKIAGTDYNFFGVSCRRTDSGFYTLGISSIGEAYIGIYKDNWLNVLANPIYTKRYSSRIHIRGDCIGNTLTLYVNNIKMVTATDNSFSSGYVGVTASVQYLENPSLKNYGGSTDADILFDNFYVYKP
jgi:hypothetical protein